jgi:hypothetical protein
MWKTVLRTFENAPTRLLSYPQSGPPRAQSPKHLPMSQADAVEPDSGEIERAIIEEHKIWQKNTPSYYDTMISHALEWCDAPTRN